MERKKILIMRTDRVGDLVCTIPIIKSLRKHFDDIHIAALLSPWNAELIKDSNLLDEIIVWNRNTSKEKRSFILNTMREKKFDIVLVHCPYTESYIIARATGAPQRVGIVVKYRVLTRLCSIFWLTKSFIMDQESKLARNEPAMHEIEKGFALLDLIGVKDRITDITFSLPDHITEECRQYLTSCNIEGQKGVIGLPLCRRYKGAGWEMGKLKKLAEEIRMNFPEYLLLITYGKEEKEEGEFMEKEFKDTSGIAVKGPLPLQLWAAFMKNVSLVISIDSGAVHLAASGKVPCVVIYPEIIYKLCKDEWKPWDVEHRQLVMKDFEITKVDIINAVNSILGDG